MNAIRFAVFLYLVFGIVFIIYLLNKSEEFITKETADKNIEYISEYNLKFLNNYNLVGKLLFIILAIFFIPIWGIGLLFLCLYLLLEFIPLMLRNRIPTEKQLKSRNLKEVSCYKSSDNKKLYYDINDNCVYIYNKYRHFEFYEYNEKLVYYDDENNKLFSYNQDREEVPIDVTSW